MTSGWQGKFQIKLPKDKKNENNKKKADEIKCVEVKSDKFNRQQPTRCRRLNHNHVDIYDVDVDVNIDVDVDAVVSSSSSMSLSVAQTMPQQVFILDFAAHAFGTGNGIENEAAERSQLSFYGGVREAPIIICP